MSGKLQAAEVQRGVAVRRCDRASSAQGGSAAVRPSEEVMRRQVVVKESPAAPRVSYERQQQGIVGTARGEFRRRNRWTNCADHKRDNKHPLGNLLV